MPIIDGLYLDDPLIGWPNPLVQTFQTNRPLNYLVQQVTGVSGPTCVVSINNPDPSYPGQDWYNVYLYSITTSVSEIQSSDPNLVTPFIPLSSPHAFPWNMELPSSQAGYFSLSAPSADNYIYSGGGVGTIGDTGSLGWAGTLTGSSFTPGSGGSTLGDKTAYLAANGIYTAYLIGIYDTGTTNPVPAVPIPPTTVLKVYVKSIDEFLNSFGYETSQGLLSPGVIPAGPGGANVPTGVKGYRLGEGLTDLQRLNYQTYRLQYADAVLNLSSDWTGTHATALFTTPINRMQYQGATTYNPGGFASPFLENSWTMTVNVYTALRESTSGGGGSTFPADCGSPIYFNPSVPPFPLHPNGMGWWIFGGVTACSANWFATDSIFNSGFNFSIFPDNRTVQMVWTPYLYQPQLGRNFFYMDPSFGQSVSDKFIAQQLAEFTPAGTPTAGGAEPSWSSPAIAGASLITKGIGTSLTGDTWTAALCGTVGKSINDGAIAMKTCAELDRNGLGILGLTFFNSVAPTVMSCFDVASYCDVEPFIAGGIPTGDVLALTQGFSPVPQSTIAFWDARFMADPMWSKVKWGTSVNWVSTVLNPPKKLPDGTAVSTFRNLVNAPFTRLNQLNINLTARDAVSDWNIPANSIAMSTWSCPSELGRFDQTYAPRFANGTQSQAPPAFQQGQMGNLLKLVVGAVGNNTLIKSLPAGGSTAWGQQTAGYEYVGLPLLIQIRGSGEDRSAQVLKLLAPTYYQPIALDWASFAGRDLLHIDGTDLPFIPLS